MLQHLSQSALVVNSAIKGGGGGGGGDSLGLYPDHRYHY